MSVQKPLYVASVTLTTTSLQTLASHALNGWESQVIDNSVDLALGVLIRVSISLASGVPSTDRTVYVYLSESEDGVNFSGSAGGGEGTLTRRDPTNMRMIGTIATPDSGALTYEQVFLYAPAVMPRKWVLFINNVSGVALASAVVSYTPVQGQSV